MDKHNAKTRKKLKQISSVKDFESLIEQTMLSEEEFTTRMLQLIQALLLFLFVSCAEQALISLLFLLQQRRWCLSWVMM